jgi:hypothetical protein
MKIPLPYEQWVSEFLSRVGSHLNLNGWAIGVEFPEEGKGNSYAEATINSNYQHVLVHVYPPAKRDFDSGQMKTLVMALVHELVHVFFDPFHEFSNPYLSEITSPFFMNILEQQTQKLTMVILKTLPKNLIPPR